MARGEVVRAIEDDVAGGDEAGKIFLLKSPAERNDLDIRIDRVQGRARSLDLRRADRLGAIEDLALEIREIDLVAVGDREPADAARGEIERGGAAEATRADDERTRGAQPLLAFDSDLREQDVPAVAEKLVVVQFGLGFSPGLVCAIAGGWPLTGSPFR